MKETNRPDQYKSLKKNLTSIDNEGVQLLGRKYAAQPLVLRRTMVQYHILGFQRDSGIFPRLQAQRLLRHLSCAIVLQPSEKIIKSICKDLTQKVKHLHISDGAGTTQEGLQLGEGDLRLDHLFQIMQSVDSGFVPEIWQGHLNRGKGFKTALRKIEKLLKGKMSTEDAIEVQ